MSKKSDLINIYEKYTEVIEELNISEPAQSPGVFGAQPSAPSGNALVRVQDDEECEVHAGESNADMAKSEVYKIAKASNELMNMLNIGSKMEPWMLSKLVKASDYICSVKSVVEYDSFEKCQDEMMSGLNDINNSMVVVTKIKDMLAGEDMGVNEEVLKQVIFNIECLKEDKN
jgi:hypothetical protein